MKHTDEYFVELAQKGDGKALEHVMEEYKPIVIGKARSFFLVGAEMDDLIQEGMIGLFKAIRDYNQDKNASFKTFANLCIKRQIYTAINESNRAKNSPLNNYISLDLASDEYGELSLVNVIGSDGSANPEDVLIGKEKYEKAREAIESKLSKLEKNVLMLYLEGYSMKEISEKLEKNYKSIDNSLKRVKIKIAAF